MLRNLSARLASALSSALFALAAGVLAPTLAQAQTVTFAGTASATASGSGASGMPTLSFNVAPGSNRIVFITAAFERDHCTTNTSESSANCTDEPSSVANSNFAAPNHAANNGANLQIQFTATGPGGSMTFTNPLASPAGDLRFAQTWVGQSSSSSIDRTAYNQESYFVALYESDLRQLLGGASSGTISVTLPNVQVPRRAGDEALLTGLQFNNVSQRKDGGAGTGIVRSQLNSASEDCNTGNFFLLGSAPGTWSTCLNGYDAGQAPTAAGDGVLLYGFNGYAGSGSMDFDTVAGFTEVANPAVINTNPIAGAGTSAGAHFLTGSESDGISTSFQFRNGIPPSNIELQSRNGSVTTTTGGHAAKFTLTRAGLDLNITKTDGVTSVGPGATTTYTIVVTNPSASFADGAVVADPAATGLTKTNVTCSVASGAAVCPASLTQANPALRVAALESGATIANFPPNSALTLTVTATVGTGIASVSNTATIAVPTGSTDLAPANNTATDTDTVLGTIVIVKDAVPNDPQNFNFTTTASGGGSGLPASFDLDDDPADATLPNSRTFYVAPAPASYTVQEGALPSGWTQGGVSCTSGGSVAGGVATISVAAGQTVTCTYTNTKRPTVTVGKTMLGGAGTNSFNYSLTGVTNTSDSTPNVGVGATVSSATVHLGTVGTAASITETSAVSPTLASYITTYLCHDNNSALTGNSDFGGSGTTVTSATGLTAARMVAGAAWVCKFTNARTATLRLAKTWGANSIAGNVASIGATFGGSSNTSSFTATAPAAGSSGAAVTVAVGNTITFPAESMTTGSLSNYATVLSCTADGGATANPLSGTNGQAANTLVVGAGDVGKAIVCTYANTRLPTAATVSGRVFLDVGTGTGAIANDGVLNGAEAGIAGVTVRLTNCAAIVYATAITDGTGAYTLAVPAAVATGGALCVEEFNSGARISTGASMGNVPLPTGTGTPVAGGVYTYTRTGTPDRIAFTWNGSGHADLNFGDVDPSTFAASGAKTGQPGNTVTYAHAFVAGTGGSVSFGIGASTSTPSLVGWTEKIFADPTCSGSLQPGAATLYPPSAPITVTAEQMVCVIVQEFIPATAQSDYINDAKVQANFTLISSVPAPTLSASYTLDDVTTVSTSALDLKKEVRNVTQGVATFGVSNQAKSGETLEYRVTYTNNGTGPISNLTVNDTTPAYTTFVSSTAGTTPATLTACNKTTPANPSPAPTVACSVVQAAGGSGSVNWIFTGTLNPGETGIVQFQVKVD